MPKLSFIDNPTSCAWHWDWDRLHLSIMADSGRGRKRKKKSPEGLDELVNKARSWLAKEEDDPPASSSSRRKMKRPAECKFRFFKDSVTGRRITHCEYKPRSRTLPGPSGEEMESDVDHDDVGCEEGGATPGTPVLPGVDFKSTLDAAKELLENWQAKKAPTHQSWSDRMESMTECWADIRESLFKTVLSGHSAYDENVCKNCNKNNGHIQCHHCVKHTRLCGPCDQSIHEMLPFHDRDIAKDGYLRAVPPTISLDSFGNWLTVERCLPLSSSLMCPGCSSKDIQILSMDTSYCIVVSLRGRFDLSHVMCRCQQCGKDFSTSDPVVAAQLGFWPGSSSKTSYVFHQELLLHWDLLQKECPGVSERSFLKSLEQFSMRKGRVGTINGKTFGVSFKEWKFCQFELDKLRHTDWMKCPACEQGQHSVHVDGNMKLYRFNSAGLRRRDCYYGEAFIASNAEVDAHLKKVYQSSKHSTNKSQMNKCGDSTWRAAGNSLHKKRNLNETGLEIAGCRHEMAQKAVNMMFGEIYGYAYYLQTYFIPKNVQYFWYDVVCQYWPWLKKHDPITAAKMKPALSVMHAKAHSWSCQVIWGGRWQNGACATTGEEVEHINSHFSRLGSSTKHMLPEGREELLTEHAIYWNRKKVEALPNSLGKRYLKTTLQAQKAQQNLTDQLNALHLTEGNVCLSQWKDDILQIAKEEQTERSKRPTMTQEEETYLLHLLKQETLEPKEGVLCEAAKEMYGQLKYNGLASKAQDSPCIAVESNEGERILKEKCTSYFRREMERLHYSISQLVHNMGKLGDSSKQRQRIRKKVTSEKDALKISLSRYNLLVGGNHFMEDVEKGEFPWNSESESVEAVPMSTKRLVVDRLMERERFTEELALIKREMIAFLAYYKDGVLASLDEQRIFIQSSLNEESRLIDSADEIVNCEGEEINQPKRYATSSRHQDVLRGKMALLEEGKEFAMKQIAAGISEFSIVLREELDPFREDITDQENDEEEEQEDLGEEYDIDEDPGVSVEDGPIGDLLVPSELNITPSDMPPVPPILSESLDNDIFIWHFPQEISQSQFKGRNGSSACSVISILLGYCIKKKSLHLPNGGSLPSNLVHAVCGCIDLGNRLYDMFRWSLSSRYLSIEEAAGHLSQFFSITVEQPLPVRLRDEHDLSTVGHQLESYKTRGGGLAHIIIDQRTSLFFLTQESIMYIDTHCHGSGGAIVAKGPATSPRIVLWTLENHKEETFGNLVFTDFEM